MGRSWLVIALVVVGPMVLVDSAGMVRWVDSDHLYWRVLDRGRDLTGDGVMDVHAVSSTGAPHCCVTHEIFDGAIPGKRYRILISVEPQPPVSPCETKRVQGASTN